jgi:predicted PurR-regulated permease PerM
MEHPKLPTDVQETDQPVEQNPAEASAAADGIEKKSNRTTVLSAAAIVCIAVALVFYLIGNLPAFKDFFGKVVSLFNPILWGALIAYLCNPIMRFYENTIIKNVRPFHIKRMLGVVLTYFTIILIVAIFGLILIPSLIDSIEQLISNYENYIADAVTYINHLVKKVMDMLPSQGIEQAEDLISVESIIEMVGSLLGKAQGLFTVVLNYLTEYASQLISGVADVILAVFISFYLLSSKELRLAQIRKITTAFCSPKVRTFLFETTSTIHHSFGGYFRGVILDAVIIGVVGFIVFTIMDIQLALMIAFIVAVTNVIPVFGPFLGAIPSAFIIFITQPEKTIPFVIAILVMQQVDGNIIAPKILGESTGISSLCVISSLAIMGSLWGILGMVIGVPVFAVIITLIKQHANAKLEKKQLSTDLNDYYFFDDEETRKSRKKKIFPKLMYRVSKFARLGLGCCAYIGARSRYFFLPKAKKQRLLAPRFADYRNMFLRESPVEVTADIAPLDAAEHDHAEMQEAASDISDQQTQTLPDQKESVKPAVKKTKPANSKKSKSRSKSKRRRK